MPTEERILQAKFYISFKKRFPEGFYYKIPDTKGTGGRRPFDAVAVVHGVPFAIEFKSRYGYVTSLQSHYLGIFGTAGGYPIVSRDVKETMGYIVSKLNKR